MQVYVIRAVDNSGMVKIGISSNAKRRLAQIQAHSPAKVALCFAKTTENAQRCEKYLHSVFRIHRLHGEWFRMNWIDAVNEMKMICAKFPERKGEHQNEWRGRGNSEHDAPKSEEASRVSGFC